MIHLADRLSVELFVSLCTTLLRELTLTLINILARFLWAWRIVKKSLHINSDAVSIVFSLRNITWLGQQVQQTMIYWTVKQLCYYILGYFKWYRNKGHKFDFNLNVPFLMSHIIILIKSMPRVALPKKYFGPLNY